MTQHLNTPEAALRDLLASGPRNSREVLAIMGERQLSAKQIRRAREKLGVLIERAGSGTAMHSTWRMPDLSKPHVEKQHRAPGYGLPVAFVPITESISATVPDGVTEAGVTARLTADAAHPPPAAQRVSTATVSTAVATVQARRAARPAATGRRPALSPETEALVAACRARGIPVTVRQVDARRVRNRQVRTLVRTEARPVEDPAPRSQPGLTDAEQHRHQARIDVFTTRGLAATDARKLADSLVERDRDGLRATGSCAECQCVELKACPTTPRPTLEIHQCWYMRRCTP